MDPWQTMARGQAAREQQPQQAPQGGGPEQAVAMIMKALNEGNVQMANQAAQAAGLDLKTIVTLMQAQGGGGQPPQPVGPAPQGQMPA